MEEKNGYVLDPESPTELARLIMLDQAITKSMGGPLVGIPELMESGNVLDVACGPGGWVLDMAFEHPEVEVAGVDISRRMVDYANARALSQQLTNASFEVMDITKPLEFADGAFDLINARFLVGVLKGERQWLGLLGEGKRLLRPGGVLRLVESDGFMVSTSPSLARLQRHLLCAMYGRDYGFGVDENDTLSVTPVLPRMLRQVGFEPHALIPWILDLSSTSVHWKQGFDVCRVTYELAVQRGLFDDLPLIEGESVERLIEGMLIEMLQKSFCGLTYGLTVCAVKPT
jgi:ubiquinone/menaquinone biosynthesis C-methylase UbiE